MVKAGVYLLARLTPALGGTELWTGVLVPVGGFTMLLASVWAMRQTDLKLMLAYTTVMALGLMAMLLGLGTPAAIVAAMAFLLVHAFYKAGLFLAVGMIDKGAGTREYPAVAGLAGAMPLTAAVVALAALSMAGVPPLFGFIGKELIYEATGQRRAGRSCPCGDRRQRADGGLRRGGGAPAVLPRAAAQPGGPRPPIPAGGSRLGPVILAALGLALRPRAGADRRRAGGARWSQAVAGRADRGAPRALARHRRAVPAQPRDLRARRRSSTSCSTGSATASPPPSRRCRAPKAGTTRRSAASPPGARG